MKHSTTLSMGTTVAGNPYLIQAAEYITPGLPYFAAIGIDDEDRHIRERVQTACETTGYAWPEGRTTLALMPTNQPKRPGLCALATAVCIMATAGTIGIPDLENTVILPAADLAQAGRPDGVEIIGVENLNDLTR